MVAPLGAVKFYGKSLPRPRVYTDVKLNSERVDPPVPVMDPLLSWAQDAHWSMGGLSFSRLRLQGRIEGNVDRLSKFRDDLANQNSPAARAKQTKANDDGVEKIAKRISGSVSPPRAPKVNKRKRFMDLFDEESEWEEEEEEEEEHQIEMKVVGSGKKRLARKLVGDFDRVAKESGIKTRRRAVEERNDVHDSVVGDVNRENSQGRKVIRAAGTEKRAYAVASGTTRTSPRILAKRKLN